MFLLSSRIWARASSTARRSPTTDSDSSTVVRGINSCASQSPNTSKRPNALARAFQDMGDSSPPKSDEVHLANRSSFARPQNWGISMFFSGGSWVCPGIAPRLLPRRSAYARTWRGRRLRQLLKLRSVKRRSGCPRTSGRRNSLRRPMPRPPGRRTGALSADELPDHRARPVARVLTVLDHDLAGDQRRVVAPALHHQPPAVVREVADVFRMAGS